MGFSKPPGVPCPPNNPHCQGDIPSVNIDYPIFMVLLIILISIVVLHKLKIIKMKNIFENFYDSVTNLLSGGKSFATNELKSFR